VFYKRKPKLSEIAAVAVTLAGMALFFADSLEYGGMLGNVLAIGSGLCFAGVFVCNKRPDTDPGQSIMLGFLINAAIGVPFVFFMCFFRRASNAPRLLPLALSPLWNLC
jgi:drug/metabolite transporter (DMT)-like permease